MLSHAALYAYGMVRKRSEPPDIVGIDNRYKVYPVEWKDLCVLVSRVDVEQFQNQVKDVVAELTKTPIPSQHEATAILEAHEHVIDIIMQRDTIVPLKFGTILRDEDAALQMLRENEEHFSNLLSQLQGKVEWGLKVYVDRNALIKWIEQAEHSSIHKEKKDTQLSKGAAYLLGKKREEELRGDVANQSARIAQEIFHALQEDACDARINSTLSQRVTGKEKEMILNAVYLLEKEHVAHFQHQKETFVEKYAPIGVELEYSGPWPPYNFT